MPSPATGRLVSRNYLIGNWFWETDEGEPAWVAQAAL